MSVKIKTLTLASEVNGTPKPPILTPKFSMQHEPSAANIIMKEHQQKSLFSRVVPIFGVKPSASTIQHSPTANSLAPSESANTNIETMRRDGSSAYLLQKQ